MTAKIKTMNYVKKVLIFAFISMTCSISVAGESENLSSRQILALKQRVVQVCENKQDVEVQASCHAVLVIDASIDKNGLVQIDLLSELLAQVVSNSSDLNKLAPHRIYSSLVAQKIGLVLTEVKRTLEPSLSDADYIAAVAAVKETYHMLRSDAGLN